MNPTIQVVGHKFPSGLDVPLAGLALRLDDIAARFGLVPESWEEGGLGPARGAFISLRSGRVVLLRELAHAIKHYGSRGPDVFADGGDVIASGVDAMIDDLVVTLGLEDGAISWRAEASARESATQILDTWRKWQWEKLYERLLEALSPFGKNDAIGDGDYWLIDDDWGGRHHKIGITNASFWSEAVEDGIRKVLSDSFRNWGVYVVFEDQSQRPGLIVYADGVDTNPRWG